MLAGVGRIGRKRAVAVFPGLGRKRKFLAIQVMKDVHSAYDPGFTADTFVHAAKLGVGVADPAGFVSRTIDA